MSEDFLNINDLKVNYGGIEAVKGITFAVPKGEIVTLIGANGAGKSSTLRSIAGLVKPRSGSIIFEGENITGKAPNHIVEKGITLVPEGRRIFPDLSVVENLRIGAYLRKDDLTDDLNWVYELFPRLKERSWQAGGTLSGGEQQMLAVGRALMSRPKVIMKRDGVSREYAELRVNAQPDDEFYRKNCNRVLRNTGTKTEFKKQCEALFMEVLQ